MRIGIMMRAFDEKGGVGVYTQNIVREMLQQDRQNQYYLFYKTRQHMGEFTHYSNVHEQLVAGNNKFIWDQWGIPAACRKHHVDVLFHPKFTAPFLSPCPVVMVVHGADWFIPEQAQFYGKVDVQYIRLVMPWYFKKCARVISVSQLTTDNFYDVLDLPEGKVQTVYFGPAKHFGRITDNERLASIKEKYQLPKQFIFTLTKLTGDRRKNFGQILAAYKYYWENHNAPIPLVVGGKDCHLLRDRYQIPIDGYGADILFPGWLDQQDLPAIYSQATVYLYPSNLEAFPIPITEALACQTPIITSNVNGLKEIAGDAALFVDPNNKTEIAQALTQLTTNPTLRNQLAEKGKERSQIFSWEKCAQHTRKILEEVANKG